MNYASNPYYDLFTKQRENQFKIGNTTYKERIKKLNVLKKAVEQTYKADIRKALYEDLRKPQVESDLMEIYPIISEIKHAKRNLHTWMKGRSVDTPLHLLGFSSRIAYEPKGVCLIIAPWNFPVNLMFGPLVSAIAAGNTVILKPSEMTPACSALMAKIIQELFNEDEVALVEGGIATSQDLLKLPFNHIFFTGSPAVGKIVMQAAAKHLTSVTLELGGKSPTIIDKKTNLKATAKKIVWGKFLNSGQTCIAPDYIFVHSSIKDPLIHELKEQLRYFFGEDPSTSESYARIVNQKHFKRLISYLDDAKQRGANIKIGGNYVKDQKYIAPTVVDKTTRETLLEQEEIFGPILPILSYEHLDEAIHYINAKAKPLAIYIYSTSKKRINYIIKNTRAGTTAVNANVLQYSNHHLPFGGSNHSGIGKAHGFFGFQAFSNQRSVLKQQIKSPTELLFPPYTTFKQKIADFTLKWL